MRILIAEDDPVSRRILAATAEKLGHEVLRAEDGVEAWDLFQTQPVDVVITDWMMPRADGLDLCRRIRAEGRARYTYLVLLTALRGRERYLDGMDAGADDFLIKPFDRQELHARLTVASRVLGLQATLNQLEGLLPICSYCKRIRDEREEWLPVESYLSRRTEAQFSHGICPACYDHHLRPQLGAPGP